MALSTDVSRVIIVKIRDKGEWVQGTNDGPLGPNQDHDPLRGVAEFISEGFSVAAVTTKITGQGTIHWYHLIRGKK